MADYSTEKVQELSSREARYQRAAELLLSWIAQAEEDDEKSWAALEQELRQDGIRFQDLDYLDETPS